MKYFIQGGGEVDLTEQDFVAQGGEGKIYTRDHAVFKIYTDPAKVIPAAKVQELARLDRPHIIRPLALLLDVTNTPVGFSMRKVEHAVALARLFTNDFRRQQHIDDATVTKLVAHIRDTIAFIHQQGCLLVDGNEMNYLVDTNGYSHAYFIDVDSYLTPGFPATVMMPTIRDWHTQGLSELTDWFAFAVVACQLFIGIHPYKGRHPKFKKHDLSGRMRANVSIFNPDVTLPAAARDFQVIPADFRDWFVRLFEHGERLPPPALTPAPAAPAAVPKVIQGTGHFNIEPLRDYPQPIRHHQTWHGIHTVFSGDAVWLDAQSYPPPAPAGVVALAPHGLQALYFYAADHRLHVTTLADGRPLPVTLNCDRLMVSANSVYCIHHDALSALSILETGGKILVSAATTWKILPHAHLVLDGCVYQNVLGKPWLLIPYRHACMMREIPELSGYKILHGRHDNGVVMLAAYRDGRYDLLILCFDDQYQHYRLRTLEDVEQAALNFVTLDNGVTVHIPHDGELTVFHRRQADSKVIQDPVIRGDMWLSKDGMQVLFYRDKGLYRLRMR